MFSTKAKEVALEGILLRHACVAIPCDNRHKLLDSVKDSKLKGCISCFLLLVVSELALLKPVLVVVVLAHLVNRSVKVSLRRDY
jgi:hypothetical protein